MRIRNTNKWNFFTTLCKGKGNCFEGWCCTHCLWAQVRCCKFGTAKKTKFLILQASMNAKTSMTCIVHPLWFPQLHSYGHVQIHYSHQESSIESVPSELTATKICFCEQKCAHCTRHAWKQLFFTIQGPRIFFVSQRSPFYNSFSCTKRIWTSRMARNYIALTHCQSSQNGNTSMKHSFLARSHIIATLVVCITRYYSYNSHF